MASNLPNLPPTLERWVCAWRLGGDCGDYIVFEPYGQTSSLKYLAGWRMVTCEDGQDRPFCPKHAPRLERVEDGNGFNE